MANSRMWREKLTLVEPHVELQKRRKKAEEKKMMQRTNIRKELATGIEFPGTIRLHPQTATVREREFNATFACVIPVGYDLITRSAINLR